MDFKQESNKASHRFSRFFCDPSVGCGRKSRNGVFISLISLVEISTKYIVVYIIVVVMELFCTCIKGRLQHVLID